MDMMKVLDGQVSELETDFLDQEFDADDVTPFPLQAVLTKLYNTELFSESVGADADAMELAVLFSNTFGEPISVERVREAQETADERIETGDLTVGRQTVVMQELVAAYGRDYAFTTTSFRRQYDAVKWFTVIGLYRVGDVVVNGASEAVDRLQPHVQEAKARLKRAVRSRLPTMKHGGEREETQVYDQGRSGEHQASEERTQVKAD